MAERKRQALRRADEPGVSDALVCEELGVSTRHPTPMQFLNVRCREKQTFCYAVSTTFTGFAYERGGLPPLPGKHVSVADDQPKDELSPVGTLGSELNVELTAWIDYDLLINITFRFLVNVNIGF